MTEKDNMILTSWLTKASHDLRNAEIILNQNESNLPFDTVCFHCQQTGEKYLKAYLIYLDLDFPFTHNLADLITKAATLDKDIESLIYEAEQLTPYAVEIRYPDDYFNPTSEEAKEAFFIANKIKDYILIRIQPNSKA
ncbi:MAG: DNA-binding protein [Spirochaetes bacterium]|nr:MAG: DNA-binding protein [Spirochaetota bacterium]